MRFGMTCLHVMAVAAVAGTPGLTPTTWATVDDGQREIQWAPDVFGGYASDRVLIKVRPGVDVELGLGGAASISPAIDAAMVAWDVTNVRTAVRHTPKFIESAHRIGLDRWYILEVPTGTDTPAMAEQFGAFALVEVAEVAGIGGTAHIPNDPSFGELYGLHNTGQVIRGQSGTDDADMDAPEAWDIFTGDPNVTIAIIDSGVDDHPDFTGRLLEGYNSVNGTNQTNDACPHGTHVAGTVGAAGDNGLGVAGVHWTVDILPVRVLTGCGGSTDQCADGIIWSVDNGADVGTMSLQYYSFSQYFEDSTTYARDNNVLLIAANGNGQGRRVAWPAAFEWTVGVAATNNRDQLASFSNYGPECELSAAGENVYSTWVGNGYTYLSGTSMATPHTAGLACLVWSYNEALLAQDVRDILIASVDDLGDPGWDERYGYGRINALLALENAGPSLGISVPSPLIGGLPASIDVTRATPGERIYFAYSVDGLGDTFIPQLNVTLGIVNPQLAGSAVADAQGEASIIVTPPDINLSFWMQAAQFELTSRVEAAEVIEREIGLTVPELLGGLPATLSVTGANANEPVYFLYSGDGLGQTFVPQLNVTLDIANPVLAGSTTTDAQGEATFTSLVPNAALSVWIQAAQFELTSGVVAADVIEREIELRVPLLFGGIRSTISVSEANPNETVYFLYSLDGLGQTPVPPLNVTLGIANPVLAGSTTTDADGNADLTMQIPDVSATIWVQAAQDRITSNVVEADIQ